MGLKYKTKAALVYECKECGLSDTRTKSEEPARSES
jgi:hypothetical protein